MNCNCFSYKNKENETEISTNIKDKIHNGEYYDKQPLMSNTSNINSNKNSTNRVNNLTDDTTYTSIGDNSNIKNCKKLDLNTNVDHNKYLTTQITPNNLNNKNFYI